MCSSNENPWKPRNCCIISASSSEVRSATVAMRQWSASVVPVEEPDDHLGVAGVDASSMAVPVPPPKCLAPRPDSAPRSRPMSSAGADCVIALAEMRSAPVVGVGGDRLEGDAARDLDERGRAVARRARSRRTSPRRRASCCRASRRRRRRATASSTWSGAVALDLDAAPGHSSPGSEHGGRDRRAREVVVLDQHHVGQRSRGGWPRPRRAPRPSPAPAARAGSCGCRGPRHRRRRRSTNCRVSDAIPDRWHRKLSAVRSPVRIERRGPSTRPID